MKVGWYSQRKNEQRYNIVESTRFRSRKKGSSTQNSHYRNQSHEKKRKTLICVGEKIDKSLEVKISSVSLNKLIWNWAFWLLFVFLTNYFWTDIFREGFELLLLMKIWINDKCLSIFERFFGCSCEAGLWKY